MQTRMTSYHLLLCLALATCRPPELLQGLRSLAPPTLDSETLLLTSRWGGGPGTQLEVCQETQVFIFERTISGHLRRVDCYPQRFDFCSVTRDMEPGGGVEVELGLVVSHCRVQQFRSYMICLAESLDICTRLFSFELAIPFTYEEPVEKQPAVDPENFMFKKTDFLDNSLISRTTNHLPTPKIEDNHDLIDAAKGAIATKMTISMKVSKETHKGKNRTVTKEDKSVEDVLLKEDKEKVRMYYLLLPLFMLLVAFMCLLCILTVLLC